MDKKLFLITTVLLTFLPYNFLHAAEIGDDPSSKSQPMFESQYDQDDAYEDETSIMTEDDIEKDLDLTSEEKRGQFNFGLGATIGTAKPWQHYSLSLYTVMHGNSYWVWSLGGGEFNTRGEIQELPFQIKIDSKSFDLSKRWFVTSKLPLYISLGGGLAFWKGSLDPVGTNIGEDKTTAEKLASGFAGNGVYLFTGLGVSVVKKSGFFIDYQILGLGLSRLTSATFSNESTDGKKVLTKYVEKGQAWGFANITAGMFF